jgi:hypothetical protein
LWQARTHLSGFSETPIDALEELAADGAELAHEAAVVLLDQGADGGVRLGQREEALVAQPR